MVIYNEGNDIYNEGDFMWLYTMKVMVFTMMIYDIYNEGDLYGYLQ